MSFYGGIEIDGDQVRATVIEGSAKKYRVVDFVEGDISGETLEERSEALREVIGSAFLSKERSGLDVALSIGADKAILREISVPYSKDEMIAKTIRYESEAHIFSASVDDLLIEYIKCSESEAGSRLVLAGVEKKHFAEQLELLRGASIDPAHAELNATALATAYLSVEPGATTGSTLLVQIEREHTTFVLLEEGKITKLRSVWNVIHESLPDSPLLMGADWDQPDDAPGDTEAAIDDVEAAIEDRFAEIERSLGGLEPKSGEPGRATPASLPDGEGLPPLPSAPLDDPPMFAVVSDEEFARFTEESALKASDAPAGEGSSSEGSAPRSAAVHALARVGDPFDRIVLELERTFASYLLGGTIDALVESGGESRPMDAVRRLSEHFEVEATEVALDRVDAAISGTTHDAFCQNGGVSLGLAMRGIGLNSTQFELRRDEFRFERRFERLMPSLTLVSLLLALLSLVWMVGEHSKVITLKEEVRILRGTQAQMFEKFFGVPSAKGPSTKDYHTEAKEQLKRLARNGGQRQARLKQYAGAMELFNDFYSAVAAAKPNVYPTYAEFEFNPLKKKGTKSVVKLNVKNNDEVQVLADQLRADTKFFDVYPSPQEAKSGGYDVTFELQYKHKD